MILRAHSVAAKLDGTGGDGILRVPNLMIRLCLAPFDDLIVFAGCLRFGVFRGNYWYEPNQPIHGSIRDTVM